MRIGTDGNEANVEKRVGSNIYAYQLITWFSRLDEMRDFTIYLKSDPLADLPPGSDNWEYRLVTPSTLWTRWRLPLDLYLHRPKPQVFFSPGHYAPAFCPVPLAIAVMDLSFLHYPGMFRKRDQMKLAHWTRSSIARADRIFTISQFSKDDIIKNYAVPEEKIIVTYPGFDRKRLRVPIRQEDIQRVKQAHGIRGEYLLYLGTLQPRKNLLRLIRAFARIQDASVELVIAGKKGWLYSKILTEGRRLGIEGKVRFIGFVSDADKPALIKGSKGLVLVSLYEGFGLPILEAMALGVPTLVSDSSSLPEIVGNDGIKVDPMNVKSITRGITRLLQITEAQRKWMVVKNTSQVKKFSWKTCAEKTLEVLDAIAV